MRARDGFGKQQLDAAGLEDARDQAGRGERRQEEAPGEQETRDESVDAANPAVGVDGTVHGAADERDRGHGAFHHVDLQQEEEEQDHQCGESEESPEDLSCEGFAKSIANQSKGSGQWAPPGSTVLRKTSSSVLVVGTSASIS